MHALLRRSLAALCLGPVVLLHAQQADVPLQRDFYIDVERNASKLDSRVHAGLKPVMESRADLTNVMGHRVDSTKYYLPGIEKLFRDNLLIVREGDVLITVDPLFRFEAGQDRGDNTLYSDTNKYYMNVRGFRMRADLGPKVSVQTMFHETQTIAPQYLFRRAWADGVMPGEGRVKLKRDRILDHGWSQGHLSYSPWKELNMQIGHGKHFVGHGYRSVLLSDNAMPAPFVKASVLSRSGRLQYSTWHSKLVHGVRAADRLPTGDAGESLFHWTRARFNHLSLLLGRFDLGVFESVQFHNIDENGVRPFDPMELMPVLGVNTLVNGFGGPYHAMVGLDLRVKLLDKVYVYGQFATDRPQEDRHAWQAGFRVFDLVRKDIHLQVEYNTARPYMYQFDPAQLAHMHGGQPLAHPMGAYFDELVAILDAGFGRIIGQAKLNLATFRRDREPEENNGGELTKPSPPVPSPQGPIVRDLTFLDLNASYLFNPVSNMRFTIGLRRRDLPGSADLQQSTYVYASLATNIFNRYHDF